MYNTLSKKSFVSPREGGRSPLSPPLGYAPGIFELNFALLIIRRDIRDYTDFSEKERNGIKTSTIDIRN